MKTHRLFAIFSMLQLFFSHAATAQKITDTLFYKQRWQICEKPMAFYYRIGTLAIDSFWFYTGNVKDYSMEHVLIMEGAYTEDGYKNGEFRYYYPEGNLKLKAFYQRDAAIGTWEWYYPNDSTEAVINFDEGEQNFRFVSYRNSKGNLTLINGNGKFEWQTGAAADNGANYFVNGSFNNGLRVGTWRYSHENFERRSVLIFTEKYDETGKFKKAAVTSGLYGDNPKNKYEKYTFSPQKIWTTENMKYDNFFRKGGEANSDIALRKYLLNRRASEIIVKNKNFEQALTFILLSLEGNRHKLDFQTKEINGKIKFRLGESGTPEDISISGNGLTEKEKEFLYFLMSKFKNIQMPGTENMAIEGYHNVYFYSINMKEYVPASIRNDVNYDLFFSTLPKESFVSLLQSKKKQIKRYLRDEVRFFW